MHSSMVHSWDALDGSSKLGVLVKRSYGLERGARASAIDEQPTIHVEPVQDESLDAESRPLVHESDLFAFERTQTDVLLIGSAHSRQGPTALLETALRVGEAHKRVRVRGDRRLRVNAAGELTASAPEPFASMPLEWTHAYGGRDLRAEKLIERDPDADEAEKLGTFSYTRNRAGRAYWLDAHRSQLDGELLPNLDDPEDPFDLDRMLTSSVLDWLDRPIAASYGPIDILTFPRCMFHMLRPDWDEPARPIRELALGALFEQDLRDRALDEPPDPRMFNCAPAGLAVCRLEGNERVTLQNLHREHELLEFDLPGERPRLLIEPPNTKTYELEAVLQTVLLEPDEDRVTLTWTGSMPVAAVFPDEMCREMRHGVLWDG